MIRLLGAILLVLAAAVPAAAQDDPSAAQGRRIAITFDDVPRHAGAFLTPDQRTVRLIAALSEAGVAQAGFFVTPGNLADPDGTGGEARIRAYAAAGHVIGNHSWSHTSLNAMSAADYLADLDRAEDWLVARSYPTKRPLFRFPYLNEGGDERRDQVRAGLAARGLASAYVTVDVWDWAIDDLASRAVAEGKAIDMDGLRDLYVETMVEAAEHFDAVALRALGRRPAQVFLLHETDLNALYIADVVAALRARGWQVVTVDEAFADPIAGREPDTFFLGAGRVAALAHEAGQPGDGLGFVRNNDDVLTRLFNARVLHQGAE